MITRRPSIDDAVFVDFETAMAPGYSLKNMSTRRYVADARFHILGVAIALGSGPVDFFWNGAKREADNLNAARELLTRECAAGRRFVSHNVGFDGLVAASIWGLEFGSYFDTSAHCRYLGIGASLASGAKHIGKTKLAAPEFTASALENPALLSQLARYCATDTALCRELFALAVNDPTFPSFEFDVVSQTIQMNLRGLPIDQGAVSKMLHAVRARRDFELSEFAATYSFDATDLQRPARVKAFLASAFKVHLSSLAKTDRHYLRLMEANSPAAAFLRHRARLTRLNQAVKKSIALQDVGTGPVKNFANYYGAHTGRFSGGGRDAEKVNIHGMAKHGDIQEVKLERSIVVPPPDLLFRAADLSTIEARVVAWLADEQALLERFRAGEDVYVWFARQIFPERTIIKNGENGHLRGLGKTCVLGLGFGMGFETFLTRAQLAVPGCSASDVRQAYDTYQTMFQRIVVIRRQLLRAFERATRGESTIEMLYSVRPAPNGPETVVIDLPTERSLFYRRVLVEGEVGDFGPRNVIWYAPRPDLQGRPSAVPTTLRNGTRRFRDGIARRRLTPQILVENVVQAIARDIMVHQALELEQRGLAPAFHAHDELVVLCRRCSCSERCTSCAWVAAGETLSEVMSRVPSTLPRLTGLPVACEVSPTIRDRYGC